MQARTIRTIDTRNFRCAPPPCFAKLVFLAGMHSPPINRYEHLPLPMSFLFNALQKGLCRCRCAHLCAIDHEEEDIARNTVGRLPRSEEHTSELQSLMRISYAVFCLKKTIKTQTSVKINSKR